MASGDLHTRHSGDESAIRTSTRGREDPRGRISSTLRRERARCTLAVAANDTLGGVDGLDSAGRGGLSHF